MKVALIAGTGGLPTHVAQSLVAQGTPPIICEMMGFPSEVEGAFTRVPFRIETLATFLETLKDLGVTDICMAGAVQRPAVDPTAIDAETMPMVPRLMQAMAKGDDGTLREVIAIFEEHSFAVRGAHDIAPDLLPPLGVATKAAPPDLTDSLNAACVALIDMGKADLGQALLVQGAQVIAKEDMRGTAAMLADQKRRGGTQSGDMITDTMDAMGDMLGQVGDWLSGPDGPKKMPTGPVLVKAPKPGQNLSVDMPVIGPNTVQQAVDAGLSGIVVAHGGVMVIDLAHVVKRLDAHGMFLLVTPLDTQ